ncbi:MAG: outer membrane lipoprotein-sorting protein [Firmicutes bacterium]|nr:outer membrane lipoprotein-sorting protein [Bacillota bacterium]
MRKFGTLLGTLLLAAVLAAAGTASCFAMSGQDVLDRVKEEYGDFQSQVVTMQIKTYDGETLVSDREVVVLSRKVGDVNQSLLKFTSPRDVEGVGLLDQGDDIMYMYLPEFGKARRIAGSAKSGSFMGTDFTYSDMSFISYDTSDYEAQLLSENDEAYELELSTKSDKDKFYEKVMMTVAKNNWFPTQIVFYNLDGRLEKELTAYDVTKYGDYKYPQRLVMKNVLADHRTEIILEKPEFDRNLDESLFTIRSLQRTRIRY